MGLDQCSSVQDGGDARKPFTKTFVKHASHAVRGKERERDLQQRVCNVDKQGV
jgi:hypothetical protein